MLILSRKSAEKISVGDDIEITVTGMNGMETSLAIKTPEGVFVQIFEARRGALKAAVSQLFTATNSAIPREESQIPQHSAFHWAKGADPDCLYPDDLIVLYGGDPNSHPIVLAICEIRGGCSPRLRIGIQAEKTIPITRPDAKNQMPRRSTQSNQ